MKLNHPHLRAISRRFWGTAFTLIIAVAVCVQLGRQAFPLLSDYREDISLYISQKIGMTLEVESLDAQWSGLRPKLSLRNVVVSAESDVPVFKIADATAELSIIDSILGLGFAWRHLRFDGFEAAFTQSETGKWSILGMPPASQAPQQAIESDAEEGGFQLNDPYDIFLFGRRVNIGDARFQLHFASGNRSQIVIPNISLENDLDFHRLEASIDVGAGRKVFSLIVEGHGDPHDENFIANGFVQFSDFPAHDVLNAIGIHPENASDDGASSSVDLSLWFRSNAQRGLTLRGKLDSTNFPAMLSQKYNLPAEFSSEFTGKAHKDRGWEMSFGNAQARWVDAASPHVDVSLSGDFQSLKRARIRKIDVGAWMDVASHVGIHHEAIERVLGALKPKGILHNVDVRLTSKDEGFFDLNARVERASVEAFQGAPAIDNANGFVSLGALGGRFDLDVQDGFTLGLPKVYHDPLYFAQANGQISWEIRPDEKFAYITSGLLTVTNPEEQGKGYLSLDIPFSKKAGSTQMTLAIGIKDTLAKNHKKYVPKTIPKDLYQWLGTSIKDGRIANAKFLYHGSVDKDPLIPPSIQLFGEVYDGNLAFDPNWPELLGVNGRLNLDNNDLDISVKEASLLGNSVYDAKIHLVNQTPSSEAAISIEGSAAGDAASAMTLIKNSPIKQHIGSAFDLWDVSGGVSAKVELLIPLSAKSQNFSHKIDVAFSKAKVHMPDIQLDIDDINGELHYQTELGVFTEKLSGTIWGEKFYSSIASPLAYAQSDRQIRDTQINFSGRASIDSLYAWTKRPELKFFSGRTDLVGQLYIPSGVSARPIEINVETPLAGVAIDFPAPFGKSKQDVTPLHSRLRFYDSGVEYRFSRAGILDLTLYDESNMPLSAKVYINPEDIREQGYQPIDSTGRFDVTGELAQFDLELWNEVKERYFEYSDLADAERLAINGGPNNRHGGQDSAEIQATFDVAMDEFLLGTFAIENLHVKGARADAGWGLNLTSELLAGKIFVADGEAPISLDLEYLRFVDESDTPVSIVEGVAEDQVGNTLPVRESVFEGVDLASAVALDFKTQELSIDGENYGDWVFKLRPIDGGIVIHDIRAHVKGMTVGTAEAGGEFLWLHDEQGHSSQFTGAIDAENLADVFEAWGQEKLMESESAHIEVDAQWSAAPDMVSLQNVRGLVGLDVRKGYFSRGAGSDENGLLRLLALFNFDTILRRLRLDFSDLAAQGFSYDHLYGDINFEGGNIYLTEPLIVESSSSVIRVAGTVDAVNEKIDSEMVVTLPVASNVAVATAVVVGLPAALGVYVMSKLFKRQVDRASSINMAVNGDWADPKFKVKKIFDIDAAKRRGKEVKAQNERDAQVPEGHTPLEDDHPNEPVATPVPDDQFVPEQLNPEHESSMVK